MAFDFNINDLSGLVAMKTQKRVNLLLRDAMNAVDGNSYELKMREATKEITGYEGVEIYDSEDAVYLDGGYFGVGMPVWQPLFLQKVDEIAEDLLLRNAIVTVSQDRKVVVTDVQGADGSVKEYINNGDYQVSVQGSLFVQGNNFPKDQINALREYMEAKVALPIISGYLNSMQIYELAVTKWSLGFDGHINAIPYKFTALSDKPIELILNQEG